MTDKELIKLSRENLRKSKQGSLCELYDEAFIKGYKLGRPKWHDMRKNPKDLPPVGMGVIISGYLGDMKGLLGLDDWDGVEWTNTDMPGLVRVAWCEIPTFNTRLPEDEVKEDGD